MQRISSRYTDGALPPYRHRPGRTPHPVRDPQGHSFGKAERDRPTFDRHRWMEDEDYLDGVDLYNAGYFWEAHEAWEAAWKTVGRGSLPGLFLQGLIQVSAALLKRELGSPRGVERLSRKGIEKLERVRRSSESCCGIDLGCFIREIEQFLANPGPSAHPGIRLNLPG